MAIFNLRATVPLAACLIVLAFLTACSSAGRTIVTTLKSQSIPRDATASLIVKSVTRKPNKFQFEIEQLLRKDLSTGLVDAGIFRSVSNPSNEADYQIDARIEGIRIISVGQRIWMGFMSGRSYVKVHFDIRQTKSNQIIASFQTTGYGAKTVIGAQSYGYDDPVREVVAHVIQNLQ